MLLLRTLRWEALCELKHRVQGVVGIARARRAASEERRIDASAISPGGIPAPRYTDVVGRNDAQAPAIVSDASSGHASECRAIQRSASSAAMQPLPAAVTAWR